MLTMAILTMAILTMAMLTMAMQARQDEETQGGYRPEDDDEEVIREVMTDDDLAATASLEPKMRTTLAFNHVMRKHSHNSALVMTNLPVRCHSNSHSKYSTRHDQPTGTLHTTHHPPPTTLHPPRSTHHAPPTAHHAPRITHHAPHASY